jgi:hypothetical protein
MEVDAGSWAGSARDREVIADALRFVRAPPTGPTPRPNSGRVAYPTFPMRFSVGGASGECAPRYRVNASRSISPPSGSVHERKTV